MAQRLRWIFSVPSVLLFCAWLGFTSILWTGSSNPFKAKNHLVEYRESNTFADSNHEWIMTLKKRYGGAGNGRNKTVNTVTGSGNHTHEEGNQIFNKGSIMNAGFAEAMKFDDFQCVVFHDVDMIPENEKNIYSCPENAKVRHLAVSINKYGYRDTSKEWGGILFGGVVIFTPKSLLTVNGYSNRYEGWGGEDDDMFYRVNRTVGFTRGPIEIMRYHMIKHGADVGNPPNPKRLSLLARVNSSHTFWETDGLTTINYVVLKRERRQLYTWVYIAILKPRS